MLNDKLEEYHRCIKKLETWKPPPIEFDSEQIRSAVELREDRSLVEFTFYLAGISHASDQLYHYLDVGIPLDVFLRVARVVEFNMLEENPPEFRNVHLRAKCRGNSDLVDFEVIFPDQESYLMDINLPEQTVFFNAHFQEFDGVLWDSDISEVGKSYLEFVRLYRMEIVDECRRMLHLKENQLPYPYKPKRLGKIVI